MILLENISFSYGENNIFKDFSLEIKKGEKICFFGESGCGKTTLLRILLGLEKVDNGKITYNGNLKPSAVFQENRLLPFKTILENITVLGADTQKAIQNLNALGLGEYINSKPNTLSGGQLRRVAIARALSVDFDYLILDEAFTGLDDENIKTSINLISQVAKDKTIIIVTHSLKEAKLFNAKIINL